MSYKYTIHIPNGSIMTPINKYECDECGDEICQSHPRKVVNDFDYCIECAFKKGLIDHEECKWSFGATMKNEQVTVFENKLLFYFSKRRIEDCDDKQFRSHPIYKFWREEVFRRDDYKCVKCKSKENINAHHIKSFKKHKDLRLKLDNGLTLCAPCHRKEHAKKEVVK